MSLAFEFRSALDRGDFRLMRRISAVAMPHLPQPANDAEAEMRMHHARTQAESIGIRKRAYSHRWLVERALPSGLPDHLRPRAERMYPVVVEGVLVACHTFSNALKPAVREIQDSMSAAVADAYAEGRREPEFVKARMHEARARAHRALFGRSLESA